MNRGDVESLYHLALRNLGIWTYMVREMEGLEDMEILVPMRFYTVLQIMNGI